MADYTITVCPVCGEQGEPDPFFGRLSCPEHGQAEPLIVRVQPIESTTAPTWRIANGLVIAWVLKDPRTQVWGGRSPAVLDEANTDQASG